MTTGWGCFKEPEGSEPRCVWALIALHAGIGLLLLSGGCGEVPIGIEVDPPHVIDTSSVNVELSEAVASNIELIHQNPQSATLRGRLAMTYEVNHFPDAALVMYEQASRLDAREFAWWYFGALIDHQKGNFDSALSKIGNALDIDPGYIPAHLHQGTWLLDVNRLDDAFRAFSEAATLGAGSPAAVGLAQVYLRQDDPQSVLDVLIPYSQSLPHPQIWRLLATAFGQLGLSEEAEVARTLGREPMPLQWLDPIRQRPNQYIFGYGRRIVYAQSLMNANRYAEALRILEELEEQERDDVALISSLAVAYEKTQQPEKAKEFLEYGIEQFPDQYRFYAHLGDLMYRAGHSQDALDMLQKSIEITELNPIAYERLGAVQMRLEAFDESIEAFEKAIEYGHADVSNIHLMMGTIHGYRQQWSDAVEDLEKVVELDPSNADGHLYLAHALLESDQLQEAEETLDWATRVGIDPELLESASLELQSRTEESESQP